MKSSQAKKKKKESRSMNNNLSFFSLPHFVPLGAVFGLCRVSGESFLKIIFFLSKEASKDKIYENKIMYSTAFILCVGSL
jgi:hypothetical protein